MLIFRNYHNKVAATNFHFFVKNALQVFSYLNPVEAIPLFFFARYINKT